MPFGRAYSMASTVVNAPARAAAAMRTRRANRFTDGLIDAAGELVHEKLSDEVLSNYSGVLGHYHVQRNKVDPGPAMQWDRVIHGARRLLKAPEPKGGAGELRP